jgi:hypothetical protein
LLRISVEQIQTYGVGSSCIGKPAGHLSDMSGQDASKARPPSPTEIVQTTPKGGTRSYDEINTGQMVFELQGTIGELRESIAALSRRVEV